jgi:endonuclease/exonuclease/phosphatase (EEP) superfamily protein YafD
MMIQAMRWTLTVLGALLVVATFLPLSPSDEWWVRVWEFPRAQIAGLLLVTLGGVAKTSGLRRPTTAVLLASMTAALAYQAWRILPYTPLHEEEARNAAHCDEPSRIRLLVANVRIDNRRVAPLLDRLRSSAPDVVLLLETDRWWDRQLAPLRSRYSHEVRHPREDSYGMHLFSTLRLIDPEVRFLLDDYVPSIHTGIELRSGETIDFVGVHPVPPPLDDTERRDAEMLLVGRLVRAKPAPAIVAGDLNDVAWSDTTRLFQEISGLLDPRIGRGLYPTYNANWPLLRWPLDHVFYEDRFALLGIETLPYIGSDHFPFFIELCHRPAETRLQKEPAADAEETDRADEAIEEGRTKAREEK